MSNVRLSTGSPTLDRVEARQTEHTKPPVRRNLFATERRNPEEQITEFEGKMLESGKAFAERWNYDIFNDRPLSPGNCQWEAVKSSDVPPFYSRPPHRRCCPRVEVDLNGNDYQRSRGATWSQLTGEAENGARHTGSSGASNGSRRRPSSPSLDSPSPKRIHNSEKDENVSESEEGVEKSDHSSSGDDDVSAAAEQTPRRPDSRT